VAVAQAGKSSGHTGIVIRKWAPESGMLRRYRWWVVHARAAGHMPPPVPEQAGGQRPVRLPGSGQFTQGPRGGARRQVFQMRAGGLQGQIAANSR
jgi:hypothetical protein